MYRNMENYPFTSDIECQNLGLVCCFQLFKTVSSVSMERLCTCEPAAPITYIFRNLNDPWSGFERLTESV